MCIRDSIYNVLQCDRRLQWPPHKLSTYLPWSWFRCPTWKFRANVWLLLPRNTRQRPLKPPHFCVDIHGSMEGVEGLLDLVQAPAMSLRSHSLHYLIQGQVQRMQSHCCPANSDLCLASEGPMRIREQAVAPFLISKPIIDSFLAAGPMRNPEQAVLAI